MLVNLNSDGRPHLFSVGGVWFDLLPVSGDCAELRGSAVVEPIDLLKAIYIVDLEHVSMFWDDWRNFEAYLSRLKLANGEEAGFINRIKMHLAGHLTAEMNPGQFFPFPPPSKDVHELVFEARSLASARAGRDVAPTSCDLLFCICSRDPEMSSTLQTSGLQMERLSEYVIPASK